MVKRGVNCFSGGEKLFDKGNSLLYFYLISKDKGR
jgi:hypothetical protein